MANPTITVSLGNPDPSSNPASLQELVDVLNPLLTAVMNGTFVPYVISSTTPGVGDQDKLWGKVDGNGRPLEIRSFYNGTWRRFYSGKTQEYSIFGGDPSTYFDNTGLGIIGLDWDGWAICNGSNGTPNLSDKFLVMGRMDNQSISGFTGGHWQTNVSGGATQTGGESTYAIKNTDLPQMQVIVTGMKYDPNANASDNRVIVTNNHSAVEKTDLNPIASFGANPSGTPPVPQTAVPTLPPYYTLAIAKFVGYA